MLQPLKSSSVSLLSSSSSSWNKSQKNLFVLLCRHDRFFSADGSNEAKKVKTKRRESFFLFTVTTLSLLFKLPSSEAV